MVAAWAWSGTERPEGRGGGGESAEREGRW